MSAIVVTRRDDPTPDTCISGSDCSLREAVILANSVAGLATILLPSGVYSLTRQGLDDNASLGDLDLTDSVIISPTDSGPIAASGASAGGLDLAHSVVISPTGALSATIEAEAGFGDRIFSILFATATVTMTNLIIQQGEAISTTAAGNGGGILNKGTLTLVGSVVRDNTANGIGGGGGIFTDDVASLSLLNSQVVSNTAVERGGGLFIDHDGTLSMTSSLVLSNTAAGGGGLLLQSDGSANLTDVTLAGNTAATGGGLLNDGVINILSSHIHNNTGTDGGGLVNNSAASLTLDSSEVLSNTAGVGGGLDNRVDGAAVLTNTVLAGNSAGTGGGIYNGGTLTLTASAIVSNTSPSGQGGGLYNLASGAVNAGNTTFSGNTSQLAGGGLYVLGALTLNNVTIANNRSTSGSGGGISTLSASGSVRNTLIASNQAALSGPDCDGTLLSGDYNLILNTSGCAFLGPVGNTLTNTTLVIGPLELFGSTLAHALLGGGPAIDAGNNATCLPTDQRGAIRPAGTHCDIGAFEGSNGLALHLLFAPLLMR